MINSINWTERTLEYCLLEELLPLKVRQRYISTCNVSEDRNLDIELVVGKPF